MCNSNWKLITPKRFIHHNREIRAHETLVSFKDIDCKSIQAWALPFRKHVIFTCDYRVVHIVDIGAVNRL
jgi:hypothetical protein